MIERLDKTWFKVFRRIEFSPVYHDSDTVKLWLLCMIAARWGDEPAMQPIGNQLVEVEQAQFVTGHTALWERFYPIRNGRRCTAPNRRLSKSTLWNRLLLLQKLGFLTIKSTNKFTVVTIVNWTLYQHRDGVRDHESDKLLKTDEKQANNSLKTDEKHLETEVEGVEGVEGKKLKENTNDVGGLEIESGTGKGGNDMTTPSSGFESFQSDIIATFGRQPAGWQQAVSGWLSEHKPEIVCMALAETRKGGGRHLAYTGRILAEWKRTGAPGVQSDADARADAARAKQEAAQRAEWRQAERTRFDRRIAKHGRVEHLSHAIRQIGDEWLRKWESYPGSLGGGDCIHDCSGAPSADELLEAWGHFLDSDYAKKNPDRLRPARWSAFTAYIWTELGWKPLKPEKEAE